MRHQSIYNRLRRIEGQIRGIEEMIAKEKPEQDILIQLAAAKASLSSSISSLISEMLKSDEDKVELSQEEVKLILSNIK
jgi:DNA-binding FrmR family transcriptional regulator